MDLTQNRDGAAQKLRPLDRASIWKPLDKEKREIRIILLQPSEEEDDALYADLEIASLDNPPEYKAISYVWGDASDTTAMFMNGGRAIEITRSLAAALRRFRDPKKFVALWADAVCINQADLEERADQVRIMGKIYASAQQVNVWLGRVSDQAWHDALYSFLEATDLPRTDEMVRVLNTCFDIMFPEVDGDLNVCANRFALSHWAFWLKILSSSPWFSRLWVFQEIALARFATFFSGRHSCTQEALSSIVDQVPSQTSYHPLDPTTLRKAAIPIHAAIQANKMAFKLSCCEIMRHCSHLNCQNDLDKVYSVLGLSSTVCDFPIDYRRTIEEVYTDFATSCIKKEGPGEVFLSSTCGEKTDNLPSWVPDWRGDFIHYAKVFSSTAKLHAACHNALHGLASDSYLKIDGGKLGISALIVDRLSSCAPTFDELMEPEVCRGQKNPSVLFLETFRHWQELFRSSSEGLLQVVCCDVWRDGNGGHRRTIVPADFDKIQQLWTRIEDAGAIQEDIPEDPNFTMLQGCIDDAQLFLTTSGRLGNAKIGVQGGDFVALFPGCRIPFIIRPVDDVTEQRCFKLISPCYTHGIMDGEALWDTFMAKANYAEKKAYQNDLKAIHAQLATRTEQTEVKLLLSDLAEKYCRDLLEEIVLV